MTRIGACFAVPGEVDVELLGRVAAVGKVALDAGARRQGELARAAFGAFQARNRRFCAGGCRRLALRPPGAKGLEL